VILDMSFDLAKQIVSKLQILRVVKNRGISVRNTISFLRKLMFQNFARALKKRFTYPLMSVLAKTGSLS